MQQCITACLRRLPRNTCRSSSNTLVAMPARHLATANSSTGNSATGGANAGPVCPKEPGPEDCCQSGCEHCVWEVYNQELKHYMEQMQQQGHLVQPAAAAKKASQQQRVAASLDAFEQLERQLHQQQQDKKQQS